MLVVHAQRHWWARAADAFVAAGHAVRAFGSAPELIAHLEATPAPSSGVVVCAMRGPGVNGLAVNRWLASNRPSLLAILVDADGDVSAAVRAMKDGAFDVVEDAAPPETLLKLVGEALDQSEIDAARLRRRAELRSKVRRLSQRQRQVMALVVRGWLNKQVAAELGLSAKTIEVHRSDLMKKLDARSLPDLVRIAAGIGAPLAASHETNRFTSALGSSARW